MLVASDDAAGIAEVGEAAAYTVSEGGKYRKKGGGIPIPGSQRTALSCTRNVYGRLGK